MKRKVYIRWLYKALFDSKRSLTMFVFDKDNMYPLESRRPTGKDYKKVRITIECL